MLTKRKTMNFVFFAECPNAPNKLQPRPHTVELLIKVDDVLGVRLRNRSHVELLLAISAVREAL